MSDDFVAHSRKSWREMQAGGPTDTQIAVGCLQRIADATEKMAASYDSMRNARDYWQARANALNRELATERRRNAALRGIAKKKAEPRND